MSLLVLCLALLAAACTPAQEVESEAPPEPVEESPPRPRHGDFVTIPAGEFTMGSDIRPDHLKDRPALYEPEHTVDLPAYQIHVFEVTNAEFTKTIARVLSRPSLFPVPGFGLKIMFGELADSILASARLDPSKLVSSGFEFHNPDLESALRSIFRKK